MQTIARTAFAPATRAKGPIAIRFLNWLVALDAGYRNAQKLASASDEHLADMGISRSEADAEFQRCLGTVEYRNPIGSRW
jgi:uncharacterized protein YjiS (DUF1127 family)